MEPFIQTENLSIVYNLGKSNEFTALAEASLSVYQGEYLIIFGPSGCGKSTLLYAIAGLQIPTVGKVRVGQWLLSEISNEKMVKFHQEMVGMIFQAYYLIPTLTVLDNICLPQIFKSIGRAERIKKAKELCEHFGIAQFIHRTPQNLSGGQQQRVAIVRALMNDSPILLADEPVGNLDSKSAEITMDLIDGLNRQGKTVITVTHDPAYLSRADRVVHMKDGRVIRIVVNESGKRFAGKEGKLASDLLASLAKRYPNLAEIDLKSKALAQWLITSLEDQQVVKVEELVKKRMKNEITTEEFQRTLDLPYEEGGVGLYKQRAAELAQKIEFVLSETEFLHKEIKPIFPIGETDVKSEKIRKILLDYYEGKLSLEQIKRLDRFIRLKLDKMIDRRQFFKYLDLPFKDGGVGLNRRTAKNFTRLIEIILASY